MSPRTSCFGEMQINLEKRLKINKKSSLQTCFEILGTFWDKLGRLKRSFQLLKKNLKYLLPPKLCYSLPNALRRRILGREEGGGLHFQKLLNGAFFCSISVENGTFSETFSSNTFFPNIFAPLVHNSFRQWCDIFGDKSQSFPSFFNQFFNFTPVSIY